MEHLQSQPWTVVPAAVYRQYLAQWWFTGGIWIVQA